MFFFSPLEQFEVKVLKPIVFYGYDFSITNATLGLFIAFFVFIIFFFSAFRGLRTYPKFLQYLAEQLISFLINTVKQQAGQAGLRYFPIFFSIFFIILFSNLVGLIPFVFTPTSHIAFTFSLALTCNLAFIIIGFRLHGFNFLKLFVPSGSPKWLLPLIIVIEFVSYLLRTFSLSIRLFANMMAGHTLLHILSSFVVGFIKSGYFAISLFPFILVLAVIGLELGIAFLQAYVFIVLLCIYLNDSFHPSH